MANIISNEEQYKEKFKVLKQINKQEITVKQDQNASNSIMCKVLAELENLAIICGYKGEIYFNYYASKGKTKNQIKEELAFQLAIFESSYKNFLIHNKKEKYDYPENLTYKDIISIITKWKEFLKKDKSNSSLEVYYNSLLGILEGKNLDKNIQEEFDILGKNSKPTTKKDLKRMLNAGAIASTITGEKNQEIEKEMIEKGDYKVKVVIGGKRDENRFNKQFEKYEETLEKDKKELKTIFDKAIGYLELYFHFYLEDLITADLKYAVKIKDDIKKDVFKKYQNCKDEFINKVLLINDNFDYNFFEKTQKLDKVQKDLEKWKTKIDKKDKNLKNEINNAINVFCKGKEDSIS